MKIGVVIAACIIAIVGYLVFIGSAPHTPEIEESTGISPVPFSRSEIVTTERVTWPVPGSAPTENVQHNIPLLEVKRGCPRQDCIPSIDDPTFMNTTAALDVVAADALGIALSYNGEERFYPFPMLETRELVNDVVAGDPLLVSYCPLCGTGIVFDRTLDGKAVEFGVSGMLWQSNLLMYNRAERLEDRNLWSQVLGEAVIGNRTGQRLTIIPSDIMRFSTWVEKYPEGAVLEGIQRDPYNGQYYEVASRFGPNFVDTGVLEPDAYVYGLVVDGISRAYPREVIPDGSFQDMIGQTAVTIERSGDVVRFSNEAGDTLPDVEGFWFSWKAAHPDTTVWNKQ